MNLTCPVIMVISWQLNFTLLVFGWGLGSISLRWWQYGRTFLSATIGVLFSQGLFRPCRRKPLPESYYTYFSIHRPLYFANKQWKDSRIWFVFFIVLSGDHVKTANMVTSNCFLIIFISPYSRLCNNCVNINTPVIPAKPTKKRRIFLESGSCRPPTMLLKTP